MWKLIDYRKEEEYNGVDVDIESWYLIENIKNNEKKWLDESDYRQFVKLKLIL
ncbi:MAG: hypothetical protein WD512_09010 [Candidatus Paceibacterota bacterium]